MTMNDSLMTRSSKQQYESIVFLLLALQGKENYQIKYKDQRCEFHILLIKVIVIIKREKRVTYGQIRRSTLQSFVLLHSFQLQ